MCDGGYGRFLRSLSPDTRGMFRRWARAGAAAFVLCMSDRQRMRVLESFAPLVPRSVHRRAVYHMDMRMPKPLGDTHVLFDAYLAALKRVFEEWVAYTTMMDGIALRMASPAPSLPPPPSHGPSRCTREASRRAAAVHRLMQHSSSPQPATEYLCEVFPDINTEAHAYFLQAPQCTSPSRREHVGARAMVGIRREKQRAVWYQYEYFIRSVHDHRRRVQANPVYT